MPSLAAPSPDPDKANPFNDAIRHLIDSGGDDVGDGGNDIAAPTQLFTNNSNDAGNVAAVREKRPASPRKTSAIAAVSSPAKKKSNTSSSPTRTAFTAVARVAVAAAAVFGVGETTDIALPPVISRRNPSPTSVADNAPPSSAQKPKRSSGPKMIGLVPKTQLLPWLRNPKTWGTIFEKKSDGKMKSEINSRRQAMLYHFTKAGKTKGGEFEVDVEMERPVTRSSVETEDDWVIDLDAANCTVTDTRRLSRYMFEHLITLPINTPILLLVCVEDDEKQFSLGSTKSSEIESAQQLPRRYISGKQYFQFRCKLSDVQNNEQVTMGSTAGLYSEKRFRADVTEGQGGFQVKFDASNAVHHLTGGRF